ncbi:MAG: hypothetical protein WAV72_06815, partial [Bradyrhizobium sp.]
RDNADMTPSQVVFLWVDDAPVTGFPQAAGQEGYTIKDGNFTASGNPGPPQHKCKQRTDAPPSRALAGACFASSSG